ncbi:MAG: cyclase family protein [Crocinitomicaceae bacterium]|nr:cyclase family protein [Crocinitomicaceae bacterium]
MKFALDVQNYIDTSKPLDISIPLSNNEENPKAWYVDTPVFEPVRTEHYTGSVAEGGSVNFRDIFFNPHGHGTHTECLGHITEHVHSINKTLTTFFFKANLITLNPIERENEDGELDRVITIDLLEDNMLNAEALIIRTNPNGTDKKHRNYSSTNPIYFDVECARKMIRAGVKHVLIDLPSVDRENDNGELAFHHAFWEVPENPNFERTITELVYVNDSIVDGSYILNFQLAPFENDASPSRPVLYEIEQNCI